MSAFCRHSALAAPMLGLVTGPAGAPGLQESTLADDVCPLGCVGGVMTIPLHGASGCDITLTSCSGCDRRWWRRDGQLVDLRELLDELSPAAMRRAS